MTEKRAGRELAKRVAVTMSMLLSLYVGAYYWLVDIDVSGEFSGNWERPPTYAFPGDQVESPSSNPLEAQFRALFAPIHWLDRRIRPHVWEPK